MADRVVLAYSGGLDTSVAVRWLIENEDVEIIAVAVDVGQGADRGGEDWGAIRARALAAGAVEAVVVDARREMAEEFCIPALQANARYEGKYPLVSALSRPVIVRRPGRRGTSPRRRPRWRTAARARATTRCASRSACAPWPPTSGSSRRRGSGV